MLAAGASVKGTCKAQSRGQGGSRGTREEAERGPRSRTQVWGCPPPWHQMPRGLKSEATATGRQRVSTGHLQRSPRGAGPELSWQNPIGEKLVRQVNSPDKCDGSPSGSTTEAWALGWRGAVG